MAFIKLLLFSLFIIVSFSILTASPSYAVTCSDIAPNYSGCTPTYLTNQSYQSCSYDEVDYSCTQYTPPFTCIVKTPLDCGTGVTVCGADAGGGNSTGYTCADWCKDTYKSHCTDSVRLRMAYEGSFYKTSGCVGCGHPGYPDCANHTNPPYYGCATTGNSSAACKTYYETNYPLDTRHTCLYFTEEVCTQEVTDACLTNNECTNAGGTSSTNACPGTDSSLQCTGDHVCVSEIQQTTPTPTSAPTPTTTPTPIHTATPIPTTIPTPTGTCSLSGTVSGKTATATINNKLGRNTIGWSVYNTGTSVTIDRGSNGGPSSTTTNLASGSYKYKAHVYCDPQNTTTCPYGDQVCDTWSFSVTGSTPVPGICLVCDRDQYRTTSPGNCNSSTPSCSTTSPNQGACRGSSSVGVGTSCGRTIIDPPINDAWITTIARFKLPDTRDYSGEGIPKYGWIPIYLGVVQHDSCWNSTWGYDDTVPTGYVRSQNWSLYGVDGEYLAPYWNYQRRGWTTFQWEIKGTYFGDVGWHQQDAMHSFSEFLYPAFPDGFTVTRDPGTYRSDVCSGSGSNKGSYCISLNTLQGDLSSKGSQCSGGGYYQVINFTVTPPSPGTFTLNPPVSKCIGANPSIELSWGASSTATNYDIYRRSENDPSYSWIGQQDELNKALSDLDVTSGLKYYYKVIASNGYSTRESSNIESVTAVSCDTTPPDITPHFPFPFEACLDPIAWSGIQNMSATVTDEAGGSGVGSVKFVISQAGKTDREYSASDLTLGYWGTTVPFPGVGSFNIKVVAKDIAGNPSQSASYPFQTEASCIGPWIQTTGGDVHSNTLINAGKQP